MLLLKRAASTRSLGSAEASSPTAADETPLTPYAAKIPKLAKSGSRDFDALLPTYEATIKKIIAKLQMEPQHSLGVWAQLSMGILAEATKGKNSEYWDDSYTRVWRLPKYFFVAVLVRKSDLSTEDLDKIDGKGGDAIRNMADALLQLKQTDVLPPQLKHKTQALAPPKKQMRAASFARMCPRFALQWFRLPLPGCWVRCWAPGVAFGVSDLRRMCPFAVPSGVKR